MIYGRAGVVLLALCLLVAACTSSGPDRPPGPAPSPGLGTLAPTVGIDPSGVPTTSPTGAVPGGGTFPSLEWQPDRPRVDLAGMWRSRRFAADHAASRTDRAQSLPGIERTAGGAQLPGYDDSGWAQHPVPSPENAMRSPQPPEDYQDGVWYRRTVAAPAPGAGQRVRLVFEAVASIADVWVDGRWAGYHEGGYSPFVLDVTDALAPGRSVSVAVRVDNPPPGPGAVPSREADWVNYTGIIGGVYLEYVPVGGISRVDAVPRALPGRDPRERIALDVTVVVDGPVDAGAVGLVLNRADVGPDTLTSRTPAELAGAPQAVDEVTRTAAGATVVRIGLEIDRPRLWSPADPALYVLTATVPGDRYATQTGLRTVGVAADGPDVLLNGRAARFVGFNRHEEWPDSGRTVADPARVAADLQAIRGAGATLLRTAHYPNHPLTYLIADRIGLAVIEEIPMWWADEQTFVDQDRRRIADQMWREMIFRDRNRPSVVAWSAVNEGFAPRARAAYLNRLLRELRLHFPDGRLVTQSAAADRPGPDDPSRDQVDVAGFTLYPGTFDDAPAPEVTRRATEFLDAARAARPGQPMWVTEFGAYAGRDGALAGRQAELFSAVWAALSRRDDLAGAAWWAVADSFTPIAGVNTFGLRSRAGGPARPVADRLIAAFRSAPPVSSGPLRPARPVLVPAEIPPGG